MTNRYAPDPKHEALGLGSTLLMSGDAQLEGLPPVASEKRPSGKGSPIVSVTAPFKKQANAPKQFELIHKNKIQLLRQYLGPDVALKASKISQRN